VICVFTKPLADAVTDTGPRRLGRCGCNPVKLTAKCGASKAEAPASELHASRVSLGTLLAAHGDVTRRRRQECGRQSFAPLHPVHPTGPAQHPFSPQRPGAASREAHTAGKIDPPGLGGSMALRSCSGPAGPLLASLKSVAAVFGFRSGDQRLISLDADREGELFFCCSNGGAGVCCACRSR
jgi:hypothetical protein